MSEKNTACDHPDDLLTCEEVARLHPVSTVTRRRLVRAGSFPQPFRISARRIAWRRGDVLAWLESRRGR